MNQKKTSTRVSLKVLESSPTVYLNRSTRLGHIQGPDDIVKWMRNITKREKREIFVAFYLTARNRIFRAQIISVGTLNASLVHPREVFRPAIRHSAAAVIVSHNHPSGDTSPSTDDTSISLRLKQVGELLGIELLDHIIVTSRSHVSCRERGIFGLAEE